MARDHARIQTAIWRNREFRDLPRDAQHLYFVLLSQPTLSYCGVLDWWPNRLANLSGDADEQAVYAAAKALIDAEFIGLDAETSEVMIRTYIKHDGVMQRVNMGKAMTRALMRVSSLPIQDCIRHELAKLYLSDPRLAGWVGLQEIGPDDFAEVIDLAGEMS